MSIIHDESSSPDDPRLTKIVKSSSDSFPLEDLLGDLPKKVGRYHVLELIGHGGLCFVLKGFDSRLERPVAIKIPRLDRRIDESVWRELLHEARSVAKLRHESIISVIDVEQEEDGTPYVVMEFVDGTNLHNYWMGQRFDLRLALKIIRQIAVGLKFIHEHGMVHRDLKPTNIIIDRKLNARIADFGLAVELNSLQAATGKCSIAGTSRFMSPEQLSGETHRIDERTDLWGLGVVIYWMCSGDYPFYGSSFVELHEQIKTQSHRHLDQSNSKVPTELDRICRKCLSELMRDRYASVDAFLEDLESLESNTGPGLDSARPATGNKLDSELQSEITNYDRGAQAATVVPKCLRPYDENDAGFFLELLPGPKDRWGNPECLRFWLSRFDGAIGQCSHGLLYGPSGCGKTSFLKAGLIPRLSKNVEVVYLDCVSQPTENCLVTLLAKQLRLGAASDWELHNLVRHVREGQYLSANRQLLIILDQFEHCLSQNADIATSELVRALRHCDGNRISCLISVRDDYWTRTQEFLRLLEVQIQDGRNSQAMQLLDARHATSVLISFGRAYGSIADDPAEMDPQKRKFAENAIAAISEEGKVNCGHLSILASVAAGRPWSRDMLGSLGGWQGIVIRFMNETFSFETAAVSRKRLLKQVLAIVESLLPTVGSRVTTQSRTNHELVAACPVGTTAEEFQDSITVLERQCRFIKPVSTKQRDEPQGQEFQLAHDMLVEPLRIWVQQEKKQTWQGRAQTELEEFSEIWTLRQGTLRCPSLLRLLRWKLATRNRLLKSKQTEFLAKATKFRLWKTGLMAALLITAIGLVSFLYQHFESKQNAQLLYATYLGSPAAEVIGHLEELKNAEVDINWTSEQFELASEHDQLRDALAKVWILGNSADRHVTLLRLASQVSAEEHSNIVEAMGTVPHGFFVSTGLDPSLESLPSPDSQNKFAVLAFDLGDSSLVEKTIEASRIDPTQLTGLRHRFSGITVSPMAKIADRILAEEESLSVKLFLLPVLFLDGGSRELPKEKLQEVLQFVESIYATSPDSYAHAVAKWALQKNSCELPDAEAPANSDWQILDQGITLVNVGGGTVFISDDENKALETVIGPFSASDLEITTEQFRQFVNDDSYAGEKPEEVVRDISFGGKWASSTWELDELASPSGDYPVVRVSARHAAMYCNWLSSKNGLEKVYSFPDPVHFEAAARVKGFRLPTETEMQYLMRGGSGSDTFLGESVPRDWLRCYASFEDFVGHNLRKKLTWMNFRGGINLPDRWGIFDILGSVSEICADHTENGVLVQHLGFASSDPSASVFNAVAFSQKRNPTSFNSKAGFRVVCDK